MWKQLGSSRFQGGPFRTDYGGYSLPVLRAISVSVTLKKLLQQLDLVVVGTDASALFGSL